MSRNRVFNPNQSFEPAPGGGDSDRFMPRPPKTIDPVNLPQRPWVFGRRFIRRSVTLTVAPPGMAKTLLSMHEGIAIAVGIEWAGIPVHERGPVWIYNAEEDSDELHRRLFGVLDHMDVDISAVTSQIFMNSGADDRPLVIAARDREGAVVAMPDVDACIEHIRKLGVKLLIVDPFVETHEVDENSNPQIRAVAAMFRKIAQEGDCAVNLVHHTRKPQAGSTDGHAGNMDTARGAGALVGVARVVDTIFGMSEKDAKGLSILDEDRHRYIRLDTAKSNYSLKSPSPTWFRRDTVTIANGDNVGVLTPVDFTSRSDSDRQKQAERQRSIVARLLAKIPDEMTLNQAGLALIAAPESLFPDHKRRDFKGRCPTSVRREIEAAVKANIDVNGETFVLELRKGFRRGGNGKAWILIRGRI